MATKERLEEVSIQETLMEGQACLQYAAQHLEEAQRCFRQAQQQLTARDKRQRAA